jgi:zinc-ribbon domain
MQCPNCRAVVREGSKFCMKCGTALPHACRVSRQHRIDALALADAGPEPAQRGTTQAKGRDCQSRTTDGSPRKSHGAFPPLSNEHLTHPAPRALATTSSEVG